MHLPGTYVGGILWGLAVLAFGVLAALHYREVAHGYVCADTAHSLATWSWFPLLGARCPGEPWVDGTVMVVTGGVLILILWGLIASMGVLRANREVLSKQARKGKIYLHQAGTHGNYGGATSYDRMQVDKD